ncbi:glycosyltransferase family 2 protein [Propionivibrio sp.]|uniref:glycosyltransferase family 2 protein n=1 Tax=Propionivibrio sp. TaxID=2212460 RepID=UPI0039E2C1F3
MSDPSVSIVIPCHNDGAYLREALSSAFMQTAHGVEVILSDDGSTDPNTVKLIEELSTDPRLVVIRAAQCRGPAAARNLAICRARGKYILPLDADDRIMPTYVEKAWKLLEDNPHLQIVYCRVSWFGLARGEWKLPSFDAEKFVIENMIFATAMFRRSTWEAVNGYSNNMVERHGGLRFLDENSGNGRWRSSYR